MFSDFIATVTAEKQAAMTQLRETIVAHLPEGFAETQGGAMLHYVVPHTLYPKGYHCNPAQALYFVSVAAQKNFIAIYHMGIYANPSLLEWWQTEFPKHSKSKLDMGKSCIRFKKMNDIPYALIGELMTKMTAAEWISCYEKNYVK
jgi:Domain of unknown function (DU1801)